jgi:predicted aspartyl protease
LSLHQVVVLLAVSATAAFADAQPSGEVRFRSFEHFLIVEGSIATAKQLHFVVDTGASCTIIDRRLATKLRLPLTPSDVGLVAFNRSTRPAATVVPSIEIGPLRVASHPVLVMDLRRAPELEVIDGIIGLDVLRRQNFQIDYRTNRISFGPLPRARSKLVFQTTDPLVSVDLTIGGKPVRLIVDTGSSLLILFAERVRGRVRINNYTGSLNVTSLTGGTWFHGTKLAGVQLGSKVFQTHDGAVMYGSATAYDGFDGILGGLSQLVRRIGFDFEQGHLQWE